MKDNTIDQANLPQWVDIAEAAAHQAGDYLLKKLGTAQVASQKSPLDGNGMLHQMTENLLMPSES